MHAAYLGAGRGPSQEQGGAGGSVQSGGRSGGGSRRTDCESCSPATEPGTAAVAARATTQNYVAVVLFSVRKAGRTWVSPDHGRTRACKKHKPRLRFARMVKKRPARATTQNYVAS